MLLIDMKAGVTIRPITTLDGGHDVNETWFEDVEKAGREDLLARGRTVAGPRCKYLLGHERTSIAGIGRCHREMRRLKHYATQATTTARADRMIDDVRMRDKHRLAEDGPMAMEMLLLRVATQEGSRGPGPEASILKIRGSELQQDITMLQLEQAGPGAWPCAPAWREAGVVQPVGGPGLGIAGYGHLPRYAQDVDLRRRHRGAEEHHRQDDHRIRRRHSHGLPLQRRTADAGGQPAAFRRGRISLRPAPGDRPPRRRVRSWHLGGAGRDGRAGPHRASRLRRLWRRAGQPVGGAPGTGARAGVRTRDPERGGRHGPARQAWQRGATGGMAAGACQRRTRARPRLSRTGHALSPGSRPGHGRA